MTSGLKQIIASQGIKVIPKANKTPNYRVKKKTLNQVEVILGHLPNISELCKPLTLKAQSYEKLW